MADLVETIGRETSAPAATSVPASTLRPTLAVSTLVEPQPTTYRLDLQVGPIGAGTLVVDPPPYGNDGYEPGSRVVITALPNQGHSFVGWTGVSGAAGETGNPVTITISFLRNAFQARRVFWKPVASIPNPSYDHEFTEGI